MNDFLSRLIPIEIVEEVIIPSMDGKSVLKLVKVTIPALKDPIDGEIFIGVEGCNMLDETKAHHMSLRVT